MKIVNEYGPSNLLPTAQDSRDQGLKGSSKKKKKDFVFSVALCETNLGGGDWVLNNKKSLCAL